VRLDAFDPDVREIDVDEAVVLLLPWSRMLESGIRVPKVCSRTCMPLGEGDV
jgi:hypothetical protein